MPIRKSGSSPSITQHSTVSDVSDVDYFQKKTRKFSRSLKRLLRDNASLNAFYNQLIVEGTDPGDIEQGRIWGEPTEVFEGPGFWSRLLRRKRPNRYELDSLFVAPVVRYPAYCEQYSPEKKITFHGIAALPEELQQQRILSAMLKLSPNGEGVKPEGGDQHYLETVWLIAQEVGISCTYQPDTKRQNELLSTWVPSKEILEAKKSRKPVSELGPENLNHEPEGTEPQLTREQPAAQPEEASSGKQSDKPEPTTSMLEPLAPSVPQPEKVDDETQGKEEAVPIPSETAPRSSELPKPLSSIKPDIAAQLAELQQSIAILTKSVVALEEAIRDLSTQVEKNKQLAQEIAERESLQAQASIPETALPQVSSSFNDLTKKAGAVQSRQSATRAKNTIAARAAKEVLTPSKPKRQRALPIHQKESASALAPAFEAEIHNDQAFPVVQGVADKNLPHATDVVKAFDPDVAKFFENAEAAARQTNDGPITSIAEKPLPTTPVAAPVETDLPSNIAKSSTSSESVVQNADMEASGTPPVTAQAAAPVGLAVKGPTAIVLKRPSLEAIAKIAQEPTAIVRDHVFTKSLVTKSDESLAIRHSNEALAIVPSSAPQTAIAPVESPVALVTKPMASEAVAIVVRETVEPEPPSPQTPPPVIGTIEVQAAAPLLEEKHPEQQPAPMANADAGVEEPTPPPATANEDGEEAESEFKSLAQKKGVKAKNRLYELRDAGKKHAVRMHNRSTESSDKAMPVEKVQEPTAKSLSDNAETSNAAKQALVEQQAPAAVVSTAVPEVVDPVASESVEPQKEEPLEAPAQLEPTVPQPPAEPAVAQLSQPIESADANPVAADPQGKAEETAIETPVSEGTSPAVKRPSRLRNLLGRYGILKTKQGASSPLTEDELKDVMERAKFLGAMPAELVDEIFGPAANNDGQCRRAMSNYDVFALGSLNRDRQAVSSYMVTPTNWFTSPFRIELGSTDARLDDVQAHSVVTKIKYDAVFGNASPLNERAYYATSQDWDSLVAASRKPIDVEMDEAKQSVLNRKEQTPIEEESKKTGAKTTASDLPRTKEQLDAILKVCLARNAMWSPMLNALLGDAKDPKAIDKNLNELKVFRLGTTQKNGKENVMFGFSREDWPTKRMFKGEMPTDDPRIARVDMSVEQTADQYEKKYGFRPSIASEQKDEEIPVARDFDGGGKPDHPSGTSLPAVEALGAFYKQIDNSSRMKKRAVDQMFGDPDDDKCAEVLADRNVFFIVTRRTGQTMISTFAVVEGNDLANAVGVDVDEDKYPKRHHHFYAASAVMRDAYINREATDIFRLLLEEKGARGDREALIKRAECLLNRHHSPSLG